MLDWHLLTASAVELKNTVASTVPTLQRLLQPVPIPSPIRCPGHP